MTENQNLIKALGIESLSDEKKAVILERATILVEQRLMLRLMEHLSLEKQEELAQVLAENSKDKLNEFIVDAAPNFLDWVEEETNQLKDELSGLGELEL